MTTQSFYEIMPTQTFNNLSEEKQTRIITECFKEFALNDYQQASISQIVKKLGIAKGSIFQYFGSKKELYRFLINYAGQKKLEVSKSMLETEIEDFFLWYKRVYAFGIQFDLKYPLYSGFLYNVTRERNFDDFEAFRIDEKTQVFQFIESKLKEQQEKGKIRTDISINALSFIFYQAHIGVFDYLSYVHKVDFRENIRQGKPLFTVTDKQIKELLHEFTSILKCGMQKQ